VREFDYNDLYRLVEERWMDGMTEVNTLQFGYNDAGELTTASDNFSSYGYTLDALGRVTLEEIDNGGPLVKLASAYNAVGSRTQLAAQINVGSGYVNDFHNTYTFDNLQRLTRLDQTENGSGGTPVADKRIDLAYNAASQFTTIVRYKSLSGGSGNIVADTSHVYDNAGRLTSMLHYHNMTMLAEYDWTYDLGSRITTQDFDSDTGNNGASTFSYDATNQLTAADHDFQTDEAYSFDVNGNRTMSGYTTGDNNRLTSDGTWDYGYDDEGNRTWQERISSAQADDKRIEYTWDYRNRLTRIQYKNNQGTVTKDIIYVYDVFDRRIEKQIDDDGAGSGGVVDVHYIIRRPAHRPGLQRRRRVDEPLCPQPAGGGHDPGRRAVRSSLGNWRRLNGRRHALAAHRPPGLGARPCGQRRGHRQPPDLRRLRPDHQRNHLRHRPHLRLHRPRPR
jgi:YD repeat-containing protein